MAGLGLSGIASTALRAATRWTEDVDTDPNSSARLFFALCALTSLLCGATYSCVVAPLQRHREPPAEERQRPTPSPRKAGVCALLRSARELVGRFGPMAALSYTITLSRTPPSPGGYGLHHAGPGGWLVRPRAHRGLLRRGLVRPGPSLVAQAGLLHAVHALDPNAGAPRLRALLCALASPRPPSAAARRPPYWSGTPTALRGRGPACGDQRLPQVTLCMIFAPAAAAPSRKEEAGTWMVLFSIFGLTAGSLAAKVVLLVLPEQGNDGDSMLHD